jgi:hypothetical protein
MFSSFNQAALAYANKFVSQSGTMVSNTFRRILTTAQHSLTLFGLASLILLSLIYLKPESVNRLQASFERITQVKDKVNTTAATSITEQTAPGAAEITKPIIASQGNTKAIIGQPFSLHSSVPKPSANTTHQQRLVSDWLSKRYRVANQATLSLVTTSYQTGHEIKFDPLLILAVMAIESGLNPIAESPMGAQGLMQVISKIHHDKFKPLGGVKEALNPVANIKVGALILKDYVARGGSLEAGLKTYVGASGFDTEAGYGSRVMAEYQRLKQVADGKTVAMNTALPTAPARPPSLDKTKNAPEKVIKPEETELVTSL